MLTESLCHLQAESMAAGNLPESLRRLKEQYGHMQCCNQAVDLLQKMLHTTPSARCKVDDALAHSFLQLPCQHLEFIPEIARQRVAKPEHTKILTSLFHHRYAQLLLPLGGPLFED